MKRRDFLRSTGTLCAGLALSKSIPLFAGQSAPWREFEVTTRVEVLKPSGPTRIWLPAALVENTPFQRTHSNTFHAEGGKAKLIQDKLDALGVISAIYPEHARPVLTLISRVSLKDYAVDLAAPGRPVYVSGANLQYFLRPTKFVPTDGIVKETAIKATKGATTDVEKARAIYDWIVDNTFRDPKVLGCGRGDIRFMLESGDLGGKCADLNALYVGMARSVGLPARHVYGLRLAKSEFGYKSLGIPSATATKSQHCRAEVFLENHGWVPVDPADVRKVVLEEPPGHLKLNDAPVTKARTRLFGSWEMNWMAYNYGQDISLPGSSRDPLIFFMYPQAETAEGRLDPLDPDHFRYEITVKELS
ncbi:MAG TPA: transglutaminase-like domain-containing protein [Candidatus Sulfotelmatobacter sp.]|nr:transglutaminase-like domain-containing protein [Candidatus Sulfotelmatobacter sp.]